MKSNKLISSIFMAVLVVIIQFIYSQAFGSENSLIGVIMAIGAATFINKNFTVRPIYKGFTILLLNLVLGTCGYIASLNIYIGLIVNIITIFSVTYLYMNDFSVPTSYIFLMAYIFMWASPIDIYDLPKRLLALSFGVLLILLLQWSFNRNSLKEKSRVTIIKNLKYIIKELEDLKNSKYNSKENVIINQEIKEMMKLVNSYSYKRFYSSIEGKLILSIAIALERLSIVVNEISKEDYDKVFVTDLQVQIIKILAYLKQDIDKENIIKNIDDFIKYNKKVDKVYELESLYIIEILRYNIINLNTLTYKDLRIINNEYELPKEFTNLSKIKRNLSLNSIIFTYSIKQSLLISIAMFLTDMLGLTYGKWIVLTMYVIMQPYAEDTIIKAKKRFKGTIIGIGLFFVAVSLVENILPKFILLLIVFFFYFYNDEYSKKVMCMTIVSLVSVSLVDNINILTITRLANVAIGIVVVLIVNTYIFPYNIEKSIEDLKKKYDRVLKLIKIEISKYKYRKLDMEKIIKLILICNEIEAKLTINNKRAQDKSLEVFLLKKSIILRDIRLIILNEYYKDKFDCLAVKNQSEWTNTLIEKIMKS